MVLEDYTTYSDIRAALGVSDEELGGETLALEVYSIGLQEDYFSVSPDLLSTYATIQAKDVGDRTEDESRVYRLTRLFATFSVAHQLSTALPMFGPKSITDGKASMSRFSGEPYKEVLVRVSEQYALYRERLARALEDLLSEDTPLFEQTYLVRSIPDYDPVTGT